MTALLIAIYSILVIFIGILGYQRNSTVSELNTASGQLNWVDTGFSIAATWVWAPALFVASERMYVDGILGFAWFFIPNVLCLMLFAHLAKQATKINVYGAETLSGLMGSLYKSNRVKYIYDIEMLILLVCSTAIQLLAGGVAISHLTGYSFFFVTVFLALVALSYSMLSGIRASVSTDVFQMILMIFAVLVAVAFLLPNKIFALSGINSRSISFFSKDNFLIFISYGLTTTFGLLSGPIGDQTFWQRAFSMNRENVSRSFILGAIVFALIPLGMGILGGMASGEGFLAVNNSIVGLEYIMQNTPAFIKALFVLCIIAGLSSTIDSNLCAVSSIITNTHPKLHTVFFGRVAMSVLTLIGITVANVPGMNIFLLFLFYGVLRSTVAIPTAFTMIKGAVFSEKLVFYGILSGMLVGIPIYTTGALAKNGVLTLLGTLLAVFMPLIFIEKNRIFQRFYK